MVDKRKAHAAAVFAACMGLLCICRLTNPRLYAYLPAYAGGLFIYLLFLLAFVGKLYRLTNPRLRAQLPAYAGGLFVDDTQ